MDPLLIDVPERIETENLVLRMPRRGDGPTVNAAVQASLDELGPWLPWAGAGLSLDESEANCRRQHAKFLLREDFVFLIFERGADGREGDLLGGTGLHRIDWTLRRFELGYWCRSTEQRRGFVTEAARALTRFAFERLRARRVEVLMDDTNERSWRVAQRAGFALEGVLRSDSLNPLGAPRDTRVYALVALDEAAAAPAADP
jgi:ribosomal-protein-serine acetyltransferase